MTIRRSTMGEVRSEAEAKRSGMTEAQIWLAKIDKQKSLDKRVKWFKDAQLAVAAYEDGEEIVDERKISGANLFHANVEVVTPSVYSSTPVPDIRVRHNRVDPVVKAACDLYEAVVSYDLDEGTFDAVIVDAVRKSQTVGEGIARVRYKAHMVEVPVTSPLDGQIVLDGGKPRMQEVVDSDDVYVETVPWDRVIVGPGRQWEKVRWIAFEHDLTEAEVRKLNPELADELSFGDGKTQVYGRHLRAGDVTPEQERAGILATIHVFEVWDKERRLVWWVTDSGGDQLVAVQRDPYKLREFFPLPHPLRPKARFDSQVPVVAYASARRLYDRFEDVWTRITGLIDQCKVKGLYDARLGPDVAKLKDALDGQYFEAKNGDQFGPDSGGLAKAVAHWPLETIVAAIGVLVPQLDRIKAMIWEASGVSDVMRGVSDPNETLGAQELKSQYGSMRLKSFQSAAAIYSRDLIRIMVEIRANLTPWRLLKEIAGMDFKPTPEMMATAQQMAMQELAPQQAAGTPAQQPDPAAVQARAQQIAEKMAADFEAAVEQVAKNPRRRMVIDVETDSTTRGDVSRDMDQFSQLIASMGQFATAATALATARPAVLTPLFKVFASQVRKFRLGKEGEAALDELGEAAAQPAQDGSQQGEAAAAAMEKQQQHEAEMADRAAAAKQADVEGKLALGDQKMRIEGMKMQAAERGAELDLMAADAQFERDAARSSREWL